ncbi:hypothetical protein GCM10018952_35400 [Streptosporangium vulgare]
MASGGPALVVAVHDVDTGLGQAAPETVRREMPAPMTGSRSSACVWKTAKARPSTCRAIIWSMAARSSSRSPSVLLMISS